MLPSRRSFTWLGFTLLLLAFGLPGLSGCRTGGAVRTPREILAYKRAILQANEDLSPAQQIFILHQTALTYEGIDVALEKARTDFAASEQARAEAAESGIEIGGRRRVSKRAWFQTEVWPFGGQYIRERVPLDPRPADPSGGQ